jgi:hypothetical protein
VTTRAIRVRAPAEALSPWLVQLGQGRGGFYTYDRLEQMVGAGIRSATTSCPNCSSSPWAHGPTLAGGRTEGGASGPRGRAGAVRE